MKVLSLFSGLGALDYGLQNAGFEIAGQCEIEEFPRRVLAKHWPDVPRWNDVKTLTGKGVNERCGPIGLVAGGVPCQPASVAGKRKGTADDRWLWPEFLRVVSEVRPMWVLAENVGGVFGVRVGGVRFVDWLGGEFCGLGYELLPVMASAESVGAPHRRMRVWFVAHRAGNGRREGRAESEGQQGRFDAAKCGADVAHSKGVGQRESHDEERAESRQWARQDVGGRSDEHLADTDRERQSQPQGTEQDKRRRVEYGGQGVGQANPYDTRSQEHSREQCDDGAQQSPLIGSGWRWPARPGEPQHGWEEPRVCGICALESALGGTASRTSRQLARWRNAALKGLGNAVVPQVVEMIGRAIIRTNAQ